VSGLAKLAARALEAYQEAGLGSLILKARARLRWRRAGVPLYYPDPAPEAAVAYERWLQRPRSVEPPGRKRPLDWRPKISLIGGDPAALQAQTYPEWECCADWTSAQGDFVARIDPGDRIYPDALDSIAHALNEHPEADLVYTDEDRSAPDGKRREPFFKPDWSPALLDSMNYVGRLCVLRRDVGMREGESEYDQIRRAASRARRILHVPRILYGRCGTSPLERRTVEIPDPTERVSVIIPTRGDVSLLKPCLEGLGRQTRAALHEVLLLDNGEGSLQDRMGAALDPARHRVVKYTRPFNFSEINNEGAAQATGEFLLFLNDDTVPVNPEALTVLLALARSAPVGAVGAKLLYPDGTLQHAGMVLGLGGPVGHVFRGLPGAHPGHGGLAQVARDVSAVTGACMMIRRTVFQEIGGWDPAFGLDFGDVDLCLRLRARGYRVLWTPEAVITHHESATRGRAHSGADSLTFFDRWGDAVRAGDPFYNPNLSRTLPGYGLDL
jgi:GT2 family glycosyltransferase